MKPELEKAFSDVANQFAVPDASRPGEWRCRLCTGQTTPGGPIIHTPRCLLAVLYQALEEDGCSDCDKPASCICQEAEARKKIMVTQEGKLVVDHADLPAPTPRVLELGSEEAFSDGGPL